MANEAKLGGSWQADELDAIVADPLDMLAAGLSGRPRQVGGSSPDGPDWPDTTVRVSSGDQNIAAVLDELGMP